MTTAPATLLRRYMITLAEAADNDETLRQKGYEDGLKGVPDLEWLGMTRPNEKVYWQGFDYGKSQRPTTTAKRRTPRIPIPANLRGIQRGDVQAAYTMLVEGHATDNVRQMAPRDPEDAVEAITNALMDLSEQFVNGTITLYRTIEDSNPGAWVKQHMRSTQSLGRFWSSNENYVMAHADAVRVLFCVEAPIAAVDWPETIVLTVDGVEAEVRLRDGAAITLQYVEPAPLEFNPEPRQRV